MVKSERPVREAAALALFAYWVVFLLHRYYAANPVDFRAVLAAFAPSVPAARFSPANLAAVWGRAARGSGAALVWMAALLGLGRAAAGLLRAPWRHGPGSALLAFGLGAALSSLGWLGLGLAGLVDARLAWAGAAIGAGLLAVRRRPFDSLRSLRARVAPAPVSRDLPLGIRLGFGALVVAGTALVAVACLAPERFYDAQVYHLAGPALFAMHHKVIAQPNLLHASFPPGAQMLYQWLWLLGGEPAARAWRPWLFAFIARAVWALGAREGRPGAGLAAAGLFAASPLLVTNASQTTVDLELGLMVLLACLALRESRRGPSRGSWLALGGAFAGAAAAIKYTAAFWAPGLALVAADPANGSGRARARRLGLFAAVAALWVLPWMVRNASAVGNPVYPYATRVFREGRQWDGPRHARFLTQQATYAVERRADLVKLPWLLSIGNNSENAIGPVLLLFAPLLLLRRFAARGPGLYGAVAGFSLLAWMPVTHIHRFLLPTWGLLGLLVAWHLCEVGDARPRLRDAALTLLLVVGAVNLASVLTMWRSYLDLGNLLAGREAPAEYLGRKMVNSYYPAATSAGAALPRQARVAVVGETRGLYWPRPFLNQSAYDVGAFEETIRAARTPEEAAKRLKQRGVSHLFFNDAETSRLKNRFRYPQLEFTPYQRAVIAGLWGSWIDLVWSDPGRQELYALRTAPRARGVPPPPQPLSFDEEGLKRAFEGWSSITWQGGGDIQVRKEIQR